MKFLKQYSMLAVLFTAVIMSSCTEDENPCPGIDVSVEIDSTNQTALVKATGLDDLAFELYINEVLIESFAAGQLDSTEFEIPFEPGEYNVCIVAEVETCDQRIDGCAQFVIGSPDGEEPGGEEPEECADLAFTTEQLDNYTYKFYAEFDGMDTIAYDWYVNDDLVQSEPLSEERTNKLLWDFEVGTYTVCIAYENDRCGEVVFCEEIIVEKDCPEEVMYEWEKENEFTYTFYAAFPEKDDLRYKWLIDGDEVDVENGDRDTDHKLFWQFNSGEYTVCLVTDDDSCEALEYCETIIVEEEEQCKELSYHAELDEATNTYVFVADFEGRDDVTYIWKVFINDDFQGEEVREVGSGDDHQFSWQMEEGVEYEICLKQDGCQDFQVCEKFSLTQ